MKWRLTEHERGGAEPPARTNSRAEASQLRYEIQARFRPRFENCKLCRKNWKARVLFHADLDDLKQKIVAFPKKRNRSIRDGQGARDTDGSARQAEKYFTGRKN